MQIWSNFKLAFSGMQASRLLRRHYLRMRAPARELVAACQGFLTRVHQFEAQIMAMRIRSAASEVSYAQVAAFAN